LKKLTELCCFVTYALFFTFISGYSSAETIVIDQELMELQSIIDSGFFNGRQCILLL